MDYIISCDDYLSQDEINRWPAKGDLFMYGDDNEQVFSNLLWFLLLGLFFVCVWVFEKFSQALKKEKTKQN
jgi:hypothetical protein